MEDKRIIELLFDRNEQVLQFIDEKYGNLILHIANQISSNMEDSLECKNDTLLALWNTIPPKNPEFFKAYICKIARNTALNKCRYDSAKKRSVFTEVALEELNECVSGGVSPDDLMESKEVVKLLNEFLSRTNEENRMLFIRRYFFGDSIEELADRFSLRANTVSAKLSRLRKSLKAFLEEQEVYI